MWDRHCKPSSCHLSCHQMHFRCAPRTTPLIHSAKSCSQGFLCDIHHIKVTRRTKSNLCGPWHEGKREEFVSDSLSCCLPTPHVPNIPGWALGPQGCSSAPAPAVPSCLCWHCPWAVCGWWNRFLLYHTNVLWVCAADAAWHWLAEFWLSPA